MLELHKTYGDVVRIAPDQLAFSDGAAWQDIMGHRKRGQGENGKDPIFWKANQHSVISADRENHTRMRRTLAHGFSAHSMMEQQPLIQGYVDLLIKKLRENCADGSKPVEMTSWYNYTTFDVIGDLAFGEPFGCLENSDYHPWVSLIFDRIRVGAESTALRRLPFGERLIQLVLTKEERKRFQGHFELTQQKVNKRLALPGSRPDFMEVMTKREGDQVQFFQDPSRSSSQLMLVIVEILTSRALGQCKPSDHCRIGDDRDDSVRRYLLLADPSGSLGESEE